MVTPIPNPIKAEDGTPLPHSGFLLHPDHPTYGQPANTLLRGGWKRVAWTRGENTFTSNWIFNTIFTGEADGITQIENLTIRIITAPSSVTGFAKLKLLRWNSELKSSLTAADVPDIEDDYRIDFRDRLVPVTSATFLYETRVPRLRLRSDEKLATAITTSADIGSGPGSKYSMGITYSFRELDKGDI